MSVMEVVSVLTPWALSIIDYCYKIYDPKKPEKNKQNKAYVGILFGHALYPSQVVMPQRDYYLMGHPSGVMTLKSAKIAYKAILEQIHLPFAKKVRSVIHEKRIDYEKNLFTVGTRNANELVKDEFAEWQKRLNLRWMVADPEDKDERVCRYSGGELYSRPNYKIYDDEKGDCLGIKTIMHWDDGRTKSGVKPGNYRFITNDYLLITKGPSSKAGEKKLYHVNFGGLHGVGTRATVDFLKNTEWLNIASQKIIDEGAEYYQILLPIKNINHDAKIRDSSPASFGEPMIHILSG